MCYRNAEGNGRGQTWGIFSTFIKEGSDENHYKPQAVSTLHTEIGTKNLRNAK
jgi:hypothetical protein